MSRSQIALAVVAAILLFWVVGAYNRLVRLRNALSSAFGQIDVQLKRRHELIPQLVDVAQSYLEHERGTLEAVTAACNQSVAAADRARLQLGKPGELASLALAEQVLESALARLTALVDNYPELRADPRVRELGDGLATTDIQVIVARQQFNDSVRDFNEASRQFPTNLVAGIFGFQAAGMMVSTRTEADRAILRMPL